MGLLITALIITVAILLIAIGFGCIYLNGRSSHAGFLWCLAAPFALLILLFGIFVKVPANSVGIIYDDRYGVQERTLKEGFQTKSIFEHITTISTTNRSAEVETAGQTNDGQYATFNISIIYNINAENAGKFFKKSGGKELSKEQLNSLVKKCLQSSTIKYDIFELLSEGLEVARVDFEDDLKTQLLENYFVTVVSVSFDDVDAGPEIEQILQNKAEADQKIEIAKKNAEANKITAENEAIITKTLADAEAYAVKVKGEADGSAASAYISKVTEMVDELYTQMNSTLSYEQCAQIVLSIIFYDTWDGKLPEVMTGSSLEGLIGGLLTSSNSTVVTP